ncbi:aminoglycoside phosphotransferase family protein [Streptomyces hoynatensis]|uniref:Kinase n=1 Tax=Streptomyces hoynatensis TaxID=1141874 RepID=A0A3A9YLN9_9ACTN|nr:aminoglycoside phosphotransferase family protein [Streptomyces hoynatensis]RKN37180.1 kinase [Streptomyces hoynatensis]
MVRIPEEFARLTVDREGEPGRRWLAGLAGIVEELTARWRCAPEGEATHGQVGLVQPVRCEDGAAAVLKVSFPHPGNVHEPDAFAAWAGRGAVRLLARDGARFAMLLERAGRESLAEVPDVEEAVAAAGLLARRLAIPAPPGLPRLRDGVARWAAELRADAARLERPLPPRVLDAALATLAELGPDQPDTLVHGDLHFTNVLRGDREPWLAIDPKGCAGDPAYDGITLLRSRYEDLLAASDPRAALLRRLAVFAEAAEIDRERARRWAQARAVTAALWERAHGGDRFRVEATDLLASALL